MRIQVTILLPIIVLWGLGTAAIFRVSRKTQDNEAIVDFVGSVIFWPLLILVFSWRAARHAGRIYSKCWIERLQQQRRHVTLRSGAENGLYD